MTRIGVVMLLYGTMVEPRPYSRFTKNGAEMLENCRWIRRAEAWGESFVDAWGNFTGAYQ